MSGCVAPSSGLHQAPSRAQANQGDATPYPLTRVLAPPQFHLAEPHFASRNFNPSRPRGWQSLPLRIPSIRKRGRERPLPMLVVMGSFLCNSELPVLASVERPPAHAIELTNVDGSETRAPLATWAPRHAVSAPSHQLCSFEAQGRLGQGHSSRPARPGTIKVKQWLDRLRI